MAAAIGKAINRAIEVSNHVEEQPVSATPERVIRNREILSMLDRRSLVLVGMMGCGKSAVGRLLATSLGLPFFDADAEIETAAGMSIAEIFAKFGEDEFRRGEERVIGRLLQDGPLVLALGGGAFLSEKTRTEIGRNGISLWLKADPELLLSRVMRKPGKRPLLQTADPRQTLIDLLEKRIPLYSLADIHITSSRVSKGRTRDSALKKIHAHLHKNPTLPQD